MDVLLPETCPNVDWFATIASFTHLKLYLLFLIHNNVVISAALPSVTNLWVSSNFPATKGLQVRWETPSGPPPIPPVSHFAVHWRSEMLPSTGCWVTVDSFNTSTSVQGAAVLEYSKSPLFSAKHPKQCSCSDVAGLRFKSPRISTYLSRLRGLCVSLQWE